MYAEIVSWANRSGCLGDTGHLAYPVRAGRQLHAFPTGNWIVQCSHAYLIFAAVLESRATKMKSKITQEAIPFLKWAGGKQWLSKQLAPLVFASTGKYIEPFLGGGSVFFSVRPKDAKLSDSNPELISTYKTIRRDAESVVARLRQFSYTETCYYRVRESRPQSLIGNAARFIYLNRTCWNGLYRVNRAGDFNVPMGSFENEPDFVMASRLMAAQKALRGAVLQCRDFEKSCETAEAGDTVYLDPPYTVAHKNNGFLRYNELVFSWQDQQRLARVASDLKDRGCRVILTNADHSSITALYHDFRITRINRKSLVAGNSSKRRQISELLITSFPWSGYVE